MPAPKFAHVVFQTGQPEQMQDWYRTVRDGHAVYRDGTLKAELPDPMGVLMGAE